MKLINKCLKMANRWTQTFGLCMRLSHLLHQHVSIWIIGSARRHLSALCPSPVSCDYLAVTSSLSHDPHSSSDSDETSVVTADGLWHHAATPPPGHTSLSVEFGITPKSCKTGKNVLPDWTQLKGEDMNRPVLLLY